MRPSKADFTYSFLPGVVEHVRLNIDGLAGDLVGPSSVVSNASDDSTNITACQGDGLAIVE